jgi:hypothetical protein
MEGMVLWCFEVERLSKRSRARDRSEEKDKQKLFFFLTFSLYAALAHEIPAAPLAPLGFRTWTRAEVIAMHAATGTTTLKTSAPMASMIVSDSLSSSSPLPTPASSEKSSLGGERLSGVSLMMAKRATRGRAGTCSEASKREEGNH